METEFTIPKLFESWIGHPPNKMQQRFAADLLNSDRNVAICGPTNSGKSYAFLFAMMRHFNPAAMTAVKQEPCDAVISDQNDQTLSVFYLCSTKRRCLEKFSEWSPKLAEVGITCCLLTGEHGPLDRTAKIVFSTFEKCHKFTLAEIDMIPQIKLLLLDQAHYIADEERGAVLEMLVSRLKMLRPAGNLLRIISVTTIAANVQDFANWLDGGTDNKTQYGSAVCHLFDEINYRPVQVRKYVPYFVDRYGGNAFKFGDKLMESKLPNIIQKFSNGGTSLVICISKKDAEETVEELVWRLSLPAVDAEFVCRIRDPSLARLVRRGGAFYHANLNESDKDVIVDLFNQNKLSLICATTALGKFRKITAKLVVLKTTQRVVCREPFWQFAEISDIEFLGVAERAGRLGFDDAGVVVVLTLSKGRYDALQYGRVSAKSRFDGELLVQFLMSQKPFITDHRHSSLDAWIRSTFFGCRLQGGIGLLGLPVVRQLASAGLINLKPC